MQKITKKLLAFRNDILEKSVGFFKKKPEHLFIFSHMRSRSSVLSHIIGSNPEVCGYSELQISYVNQDSLCEAKNSFLKESIGKPRYFLDKILHDHGFSSEIFSAENIKVIFLLREPESTIKSIINMGYLTGKNWYKDPSNALSYYNDRLHQLESLSLYSKGSYIFIDSDDLVNKPDLVLKKITAYLKLKKPLKKEYSIFENTGKPTFGDPSNNIKSGVLQVTKGYPDIVVPLNILEKAMVSYEKCKETLSKGSTFNFKHI